jgi:histone-binding protein RBBP4
MIWDLSRQGMSQTMEVAAEGPPELAFIHGGHTATINEFDWSTDSPWTIASVSENNILEIWAISETLRTPESTQ